MRGSKTCNALATFIAAKVAKKKKPCETCHLSQNTEPSSFQTTSKYQVKCKFSQNNVDGECEDTGREHLRARVNYNENAALRQLSNGKISIKGKKGRILIY